MNRHQYFSGSLRYVSIGASAASGPPGSDAEAKEILTEAYQGLFGPDEPNAFALGIAQAIGLMEGKYGAWGPNNVSNNWGAITRSPNSDGSCPADSFQHGDSSFEAGSYQTCFRIYASALDGATDLLRELYSNRPDVFQAAVNGDIRGVAQGLYSTSYYEGTAPHAQKDSNGDFTNVNNYIAFIGKGVNQIADLYPDGSGGAVADSSSNSGLLIGVGIAAALGLALALRS